MQLLEHVEIPFEIQFTDAVVGEGERLGPRVCGEIEIVALDGDEMLAVRLHDAQRQIQALGLFRRLVAGDDPAAAIRAVPLPQNGS